MIDYGDITLYYIQRMCERLKEVECSMNSREGWCEEKQEELEWLKEEDVFQSGNINDLQEKVFIIERKLRYMNSLEKKGLILEEKITTPDIFEKTVGNNSKKARRDRK
jgi:hypothetical protein